MLFLVKYVPYVFSLFNIAWISEMPMLREHVSTQHSRGFLLPEGQCLKVTCPSTCPVWIHTPLSSVLQCDCQVQGPTCDRTRLQKVVFLVSKQHCDLYFLEIIRYYNIHLKNPNQQQDQHATFHSKPLISLNL